LEMSLTDPPAADEIEVSIFGPGYGETIVVHLALGEWLIVDSCIDKRINRPASTAYLHKLGINPGSAVKILLASHWHDDHIGGLADVFDECRVAKFFCSAALQTSEFVTLVRLAGARSIDRGVQEFKKILDLLKERASSGNAGPEWAIEDRRLWHRAHQSSAVEIFALSPSSASQTLSFNDISRLMPEVEKQKKRIVAPTPNNAAVVLWINIGNDSIILGSDLQQTSTNSMGWSAIVNSTTRPSGMAEVFKIPHHGSENGHHAGVWARMLQSNPQAVLTPFINGGVALPTNRDVRRICRITPNVFSTKQLQFNQQKRRRGALDRAIKQVVRSIRTIPNVPGHVRLRKNLSNQNAGWRVELFDGAVQLTAS
jgi:Metallo-beta-lactamase superfamily